MTLKRSSGRAYNQRVVRPFHVLALDPGGTTGWAACTYAGPQLPSQQVPLNNFIFKSGQMGPQKHHLELDEFLRFELTTIYSDTVIDTECVCEGFEFRQISKERTGLVLVSKEYIGVVELFSQKFEIPVFYQTASAAKGMVPDWKLKALGWFVPNQPHANDAARHLGRHLVHTRKIHEPITTKWLEG